MSAKKANLYEKVYSPPPTATGEGSETAEGQPLSSRGGDGNTITNPQGDYGKAYVGSQGRTAAAIVDRFLAGESVEHLAYDYDVSEDCVCLILGAYDAATRANNPEDADHDASERESATVKTFDPEAVEKLVAACRDAKSAFDFHGRGDPSWVRTRFAAIAEALAKFPPPKEQEERYWSYGRKVYDREDTREFEGYKWAVFTADTPADARTAAALLNDLASQKEPA